MKTIKIILLILIAGSVIAQPKRLNHFLKPHKKEIERRIQSNTTVVNSERTKGTTEVNYYYDIQNSEWIFIDTSLYTFASDGKILSKTTHFSSSFKNKNINIYSGNNLIESVYYYYDGSDFIPDFRFTYQYNSINNRLSSEKRENYISGSWVAAYEDLYIYNFDSENQLNSLTYEYYEDEVLDYSYNVIINFDINHKMSSMEFIDPNSNPEYKYEFEYTSTNSDPDIIDVYYWDFDINSYIMEVQAQNCTYRNFSIEDFILGEIDFTNLEIYEYDYDNMELYPIQKLNKVYDSNGGYTEIIEEYDEDNLEWVFESKSIIINNNFGEFISNTSFDWDIQSQSWVEWSKTENDYTLDNEDNTIAIERSVYYNQNFSSKTKSEYSNFVEITNVNKTENSLKILVYPNPFVDKINIDAEDKVNTKIYSILGKEVINTHSKQIDASNLENGLYLYQIYNNNGILVSKGKFVKD
jgi:hypothetical protein